MRSLFQSVLFFSVALAIVGLLWVKYARFSALIIDGKESTFAVVDIQSAFTKRGKPHFMARGVIDQKEATFMFGMRVWTGDRIRVVYDPEALQAWSTHRKGSFSSFFPGSKAEAPLDLVKQDIGSDYFWAAIALSGVFGIAGVFSARAFRRSRNA